MKKKGYIVIKGKLTKQVRKKKKSPGKHCYKSVKNAENNCTNMTKGMKK